MYTIALCYTEGPDPSLPQIYYWFNRYLSTHPPSCSGCEWEGKAREKVDEIKKHLASHCSTCKREKEREGDRPLDTCSRCRLACYCSTECQREHWVSHKEICKMIKGVLWRYSRLRQVGQGCVSVHMSVYIVKIMQSCLSGRSLLQSLLLPLSVTVPARVQPGILSSTGGWRGDEAPPHLLREVQESGGSII